MAGPCKKMSALTGAFLLCAALFLGACSTTGKPKTVRPARLLEIEDLRRIPQDLTGLAGAVGPEVSTGSTCRSQLLQEFADSFFKPWTSSPPLAGHAESKSFMARQAKGSWYGVNKRKVAPKQKRELLENCDLDRFPSRDERAIAVAPGHLRGLPTVLPFYERESDEPFDMLSYPHVKLNEPLRILHASQDGVWFFVETAYSNGWLPASEVALVDDDFIESWMRAPHLVIVRDYAPVADGRRMGASRAKIGTLLPLSAVGGEEEGWQVMVASAGEGGRAESRSIRIPQNAAAPFPLAFDQQNISLIGNQLLGQPYGWGEIYDLRDCSALLRDFFLPFGIWLPRTSADQIASIPKRLQLAALAPQEKNELIKSRGLPLLTLLFKPGHIMLYAGLDREGEPLVFHAAWSMQVKDEDRKRKTRILGGSVITTLEPGKELGLVPGSTLLERVTEMGTITDRCTPSKK